MATDLRIGIIGAGLIGLSLGWRLAQRGAVVTVFDRERAGAGASWAAAGMLAPAGELEPGQDDLFRLGQKSLQLWPGFVEELEALSGMSLGYRREGTLLVRSNVHEINDLRRIYEALRKLDADADWVEDAKLAGLEPTLNSSVTSAIYSRDDVQADNRLLIGALKVALFKAGGQLRERIAVTGLELSDGRAQTIVLGSERIAVDAVVWAGGANAASLNINGLPDIAVEPVKGQMVAVQLRPDDPQIAHVVRSPEIYIVPRRDGRVLIGATVEPGRRDKTLFAGGVRQLLNGAADLCPVLDQAEIVDMWAGLRPATRDRLPILGDSGIPGLIFAAGHYRNGVLLSPVTAELLADLVTDGRAHPMLEPFAAKRFQ